MGSIKGEGEDALVLAMSMGAKYVTFSEEPFGPFAYAWSCHPHLDSSSWVGNAKKGDELFYSGTYYLYLYKWKGVGDPERVYELSNESDYQELLALYYL